MSDYGSTPPPPPPPPPYGGLQAPQGVAAGAFASWIQRVLAYLVDLAVTLPLAILQYSVGPKFAATTDANGTIQSVQTGGSWSLLILFTLLGLVVTGYNRWYLGGQGASLGKRALGLTLIGEQTGQPIGTGKAFLRDLAHFVDAIICYVGYLFPLWDSKRQTISDKIMSTLVIAKV